MKPFQHSFSSPAPVSKAFEAVATEAGQRAWWCKDCDVAEQKGGRIHLRFVKNGTPVHMHFVLDELKQGEQVVWRCTENDNPAWVGSSLSWNITPAGDGSRVAFEHAGFASGGPPYEGTMEGWVRFMASLEAYLRGEAPNPL